MRVQSQHHAPLQSALALRAKPARACRLLTIAADSTLRLKTECTFATHHVRCAARPVAGLRGTAPAPPTGSIAFALSCSGDDIRKNGECGAATLGDCTGYSNEFATRRCSMFAARSDVPASYAGEPCCVPPVPGRHVPPPRASAGDACAKNDMRRGVAVWRCRALLGGRVSASTPPVLGRPDGGVRSGLGWCGGAAAAAGRACCAAGESTPGHGAAGDEKYACESPDGTSSRRPAIATPGDGGVPSAANGSGVRIIPELDAGAGDGVV